MGGENGINTGNYEEKLLFRFKFVPVWNNAVKLRKKVGTIRNLTVMKFYKHLSSVNVRDAKNDFIRKEGTNTRSGESGTFGGVWKIDQNGNESKLIITGSDGKTNVLNIYEINKLSDNVLLMFPDWYDTNRIMQEWYNSHSDDPTHIAIPSEPHGAATEIRNAFE